MTSSLPSRYSTQTTEETNRFDSSSEDRNIPQIDSRQSQKFNRRLSNEDNTEPEEANPMSSIGESSRRLNAQRRKEQQVEYAQQLLSQQTFRQLQNDFPIRGASPRSPPGDIGTGLYSPPSASTSRRDSINYADSSRPMSGRSGVVNFGSDPDAEATKKREMKMAYGKQLQDQQFSNQSAKSYEVNMNNTTRADSRPEGALRKYNSNSNSNSGKDKDRDKEDERINAVSAAELKKIQQRRYHDEITAAAAASPITSARQSLKGGSLSRHEQSKAEVCNGYDKNLNDGGTFFSYNYLFILFCKNFFNYDFYACITYYRSTEY